MTSSVAREAWPSYVRDWPGHTRWRIGETRLQVLRYLLTERDTALEHVNGAIHLGISVEIGNVRRDSIGNQRRQIHQG